MKIINIQKLTLLYSGKRDYTFYEYSPTLFNPLYPRFERTNIVRRIRLMLQCIKKGSYKVYYLTVNNELVGCCAVVPGGRALKECTENDVVLEFLYVDPKFRRNGYSKDILKLTLEFTTIFYENTYALVYRGNLPSCYALETCGFQLCGWCNVTKYLRRIVVKPEGQNGSKIYKLSKTEFMQKISIVAGENK
jgi:RimJ/RimL family protein N-acetyltransferase